MPADSYGGKASIRNDQTVHGKKGVGGSTPRPVVREIFCRLLAACLLFADDASIPAALAVLCSGSLAARDSIHAPFDRTTGSRIRAHCPGDCPEQKLPA